MSASLPFLKMNGLGNDFVILDARRRALAIDEAAARRIADRKSGIGCDQVIVLEPSEQADVRMRIWNADGGEVEACGNATRCVAWLIARQSGHGSPVIETGAGVLETVVADDGSVTVDMGRPRFRWDEIPLSEPFGDTRMIELEVGPRGAPVLHSPSVVNVGNPHCIFWVDDVAAHDLAAIGPMLENHPLFPERANISLAKVDRPDAIVLRVWERGAGLTRACGTAAIAAVAAGVRKRVCERQATVRLPGGSLFVEWCEADDHLLMTGPVELEFEDRLDPRTYGISVA